MPGASYPKPDAERRNRNPAEYGWTDLPATGRQGPPPPMPDVVDYSELADWWADLWSSPQAAAWDQTGRTLHGLLHAKWLLTEVEVVERNGLELAVPGAPRAAILAEMRQIEDRHGLNPKAMLQLRWRIVDADTVTATTTKPKTTRRRDPRLRAINGGKGS